MNCIGGDTLPNLLDKYKDLLDKYIEGLSTIKGVEAKLTVSQGACPLFLKARPVPFALRTAVGQNWISWRRRLVYWRRWTITPIVTVPKKDRICGDWRVTVNQILDVDH